MSVCDTCEMCESPLKWKTLVYFTQGNEDYCFVCCRRKILYIMATCTIIGSCIECIEKYEDVCSTPGIVSEIRVHHKRSTKHYL